VLLNWVIVYYIFFFKNAIAKTQETRFQQKRSQLTQPEYYSGMRLHKVL
jgi:hypothetical protein